MLSQVIKCKVDPPNSAKVREIITNWANGPGKRLAGCKEILISREKSQPNRLSVTVILNDEAALQAFSKDRESLETFEKIKPLLSGRLEYFEADLERVALA